MGGRELEGKVALVTGAARGIGRGSAVELARRGACVVINDLQAGPESAAVVEECRAAGGDGWAVAADVSDWAAVDRMFDQALERFGRLDILVNNAYRTIRKPFLELTEADAQAVWAVNLSAVLHCSQRGAAAMIPGGRGGKIVVVGSVLSFIPFPQSLLYNTAKAGLRQMAATMAAELAPHRVNVNVVEPGYIDTPGERAFATEEQIAAAARRLPWGRLGTIWDVGGVVAFLCTDAADYITGAVLRVDGGYWLPRITSPAAE